jgi:hypothetical protein
MNNRSKTNKFRIVWAIGARLWICLLIALGVLFGASAAHASDIYFAQASAGGNSGADCANARTVGSLAAGDWSPGNTIHLCGTITAPAGASGFITAQGSGSSGSPITLKFETGAILQAPYWGSNGAIYISGKSYITIDGGSNGLIRATLNGTSGGTCPGGACTNQQFVGEGVYLTGTSNIEVKNLTIGDLYDHTSVSDTGGASLHNPWGIGIWGGNTNITLDSNTIHDLNWAIMMQSFGSPTGPLDFHSNAIYNISVGIGGGDGNPGSTITGPVNIYNNVIHDTESWDANGDVNHHDGIYIWLTNATSSFTGAYNVYNNWIYNIKTYCSAAIYFDSGASSTYPAGTAFNNVIGTNCSTGGDGSIYDKSGKMRLYNNTFTDTYSTINSQSSLKSQIIENNISAAAEGLLFGQASLSASDYNDWYALTSPAMTYNNTQDSTLAAFKSATGFDGNSITSSPNLDAGFVPNAGSPVIGTGVNLNSTCNGQPNPGLGALCFDKAGNVRPSSGKWDMGAYQFSTSAGSGQPAPPTGLTATAK